MCRPHPAGSAAPSPAAVLRWSLAVETGLLTVQRGADPTVWRGAVPAEIGYWDEAGEERTMALAAAEGWRLERPEATGGRLLARHDRLGFTIALDFCASGDVLTVAAPAAAMVETGAARLRSLRLLPRFGAARESDEGYLVIAQQSGAVCHYRDKEPGEHWLSIYREFGQCPMPLFGAVRGTSALAAIITSGQFDARVCISLNWGPQQLYAIDPTFALRSFREEACLPDDLTVEYHFLPADEATWAGVARCYRRHNAARRGVRPLRERVATSPGLAYTAGALEVRVRLGVKPVPPEVTEQTPDNEPPLRAFCDFARLRDILDEFHRQGIAQAEFCLVGWNRGGHDGAYPQVFPVEPALGGEEELRRTIRHGQALGYQMIAHDCYYGAYRIATDWSEDYLRKLPDGSLHKGGSWGGGQSYNLCLQEAYERFAKRDLPRIRELGFNGGHYSDVLSILGPRPCYDPRHPRTRREDAEDAARILALAQQIFGSAQSEASLDYTIPALDRLLYIDADKWQPLEQRAYVDRRVPLYQAVYHGAVLYNLSTNGVNSGPGEDAYLHIIEYGALPLAYFYGHFMLDESKNWLGQRDYRYDNADSLRQTVARIRRVYDDVERLKHLQLEFLEDHREVAEGVNETLYSNGQRVVVNYREEPHRLPSGETVPARGWLLIEA